MNIISTNEQNILKLIKSYVDDSIDYWTLYKKWDELYTEPNEEKDYLLEDILSEIAEFIYMGSDSKPDVEGAKFGLLGPDELRSKIINELNKKPNWKQLITAK